MSFSLDSTAFLSGLTSSTKLPHTTMRAFRTPCGALIVGTILAGAICIFSKPISLGRSSTFTRRMVPVRSTSECSSFFRASFHSGRSLLTSANGTV